MGDVQDLFVVLLYVQNNITFFNGKMRCFVILCTQNGFILHIRRRTRYFRAFRCVFNQMSHVSTSV